MKLVRILKKDESSYNEDVMELSDNHAKYIVKSGRGHIIKDLGKQKKSNKRREPLEAKKKVKVHCVVEDELRSTDDEEMIAGSGFNPIRIFKVSDVIENINEWCDEWKNCKLNERRMNDLKEKFREEVVV